MMFATNLGDALLELVKAGASSIHAERLALYMVAIGEPRGLALACAVHTFAGGSDPRKIRDELRAERQPIPMLLGWTNVELLADITAKLPEATAVAREEIPARLREVHHSGEVPILITSSEIQTVGFLKQFCSDYAAVLRHRASAPSSDENCGVQLYPRRIQGRC